MPGLCFLSLLSSSPALGRRGVAGVCPAGQCERQLSSTPENKPSARILWLRDASALPLSDDSRGKAT